MSLLELFCDIDDFWQEYEPLWHRSPVGFVSNLLGGLIAYCHQPKKPSLNLQYLTALQPA